MPLPSRLAKVMGGLAGILVLNKLEAKVRSKSRAKEEKQREKKYYREEKRRLKSLASAKAK